MRLIVDELNSCPHSSSVIVFTLRVDTPCTYIFSRSRSSANSLFRSSAVILAFALSCFRVTCHLSFLQPLTEFERSSLTHLLFAEPLKLNPNRQRVPRSADMARPARA